MDFIQLLFSKTLQCATTAQDKMSRTNPHKTPIPTQGFRDTTQEGTWLPCLALLLLGADTLKTSASSVTGALEGPVACNYSVPTLEKAF